METKETIEIPVSLLMEIRDEMKKMTALLSGQQSPPTEKVNSPIQGELWYDNSDVCQIFNVSKATTQRWRSEENLQFVRIGRKIQHQGWHLLNFIEVYAKPRNMPIYPLNKEVPKGQTR